MYKMLFLSAFFMLFSFTVHSQKVIHFTNIDKDSVRVESLQGVALSINLNLATQLGYFRELRLNRISTFTLSGDLIMARSPVRVINAEPEGQGYPIQQVVYGPGFFLGVTADYRLYFDFVNRMMKGKNTRLNSGLFVSIPLKLISGIMNPSPHLTYVGNFFQINPYLEPGLGYRYAFTQNFFVEGIAGIQIYGLHVGMPGIMPDIKIRGSVTF